MNKTEIRRASCDNWEEEIRAAVDIDEQELAEKFMHKKSFPFMLRSWTRVVFDGIADSRRGTLWRFEDATGRTVRFEMDLGHSTEEWLKPFYK